MDYSEAANYLLNLRRFRTKLGTESTRRFLDELGGPHEGTEFVQIAGSNGKGSTARMLASVLEAAGLRVGLYTSPHIEDFRERIRVDGRKIPKSAIVEFVGENRSFIDSGAARDDPLTHFEVLTALAIWHFDRQDVDVGILEVGIGGRYDATSVVSPVASAVTNVSLEHTDILGDTLEEIARDKVHVAPAENPLVTAAHDVYDVLREATEIVTVGTDADEDVRVKTIGHRNTVEQEIEIEAEDWDLTATIPHLGRHQAENAAIAATLARQVTEVSPTVMARGLRKADWPGRLEVMGHNPLVVLDGAHNPGAAEQLAAAMDEFEFEDLYLVFGAMHDKDHRSMIELLPGPDHVVTCKPDEERAEDEAVLAEEFRAVGVESVEAVHSVAGAVDTALEMAGPDDGVFVTGSLYTVAEARQLWTRTIVPKSGRLATEADGTGPIAELDGPEVPADHRRRRYATFKTRLQRHQARRLQTEMLRSGGECILSDLIEEARFVDVLLSGRRDQFDELLSRLADNHEAFPKFVPDLRAALGPAPTALPGIDVDVPAIMGILNVTPDSFHDGGEFDTTEAAVEQAEQLVAEGVDVLDVGGESTRPGADPVSDETEIGRVVPVIEALQDLDVAVSVDTRKPAVADAALDAGADIVNDVSGLDDPDMRYLVADHDVPVVLMHSVNTPVDPEYPVQYDDVVEDVIADLKERILLAEQAGIDREQIIVDPGIGFGKTPAENFEILDRLYEFTGLGRPILFGHSHKSMFAGIDAEEGSRLFPTVAGTALAAERGAAIIRVHDVRENLAAVKTATAARRSNGDPT